MNDPIVLSKLKCAAGLAHLENKRYKLAAKKFVKVAAELGSQYNEVSAQHDVAIYGGLCALASFDRQEMKSKVIDNSVFKQSLELVPEVRELLYDFYYSRYAACMSHLDRIKGELMLDIHLHDHLEELYAQIRNKALIQYCTPFTSLKIATMAEAFSSTVPQLEKELAKLIMDKHIQAQIDSQNKILYARHTNQRSGAFQVSSAVLRYKSALMSFHICLISCSFMQRALAVGSDFQREERGLLLRTSVLRHELLVEGVRKT